MKYLTKKNALLLLLITLAACTQTADEIPIGGLYALTGYGSQFGTDEQMGTQLAIEDVNAAGGINGKMLRLVAEDTATDYPTTATAYRKLVDFDGVNYIIGPTWGPFAQVIIPLLQDDGVLLISPSTGESEELYKNPNFFKTWPSDWDELPALFGYMQEHDVKKMTVVVSQGSWEENMIQGYRKYAAEQGIETVKEFRFNPDQTDFRTMITQLKELDADATFITFSSYEGVGEFLNQRNELGYNKPLYAWSGFERQQLLKSYGADLEGVYYSVPIITEQDQAFNDKFAERFGREPFVPTAATAYDAVMLLAQALEEGESIDSVQKQLLAVKNYEGASPIQEFDENGWAVHNRGFKIREVRDGSFVDAK